MYTYNYMEIDTYILYMIKRIHMSHFVGKITRPSRLKEAQMLQVRGPKVGELGPQKVVKLGHQKW